VPGQKRNTSVRRWSVRAIIAVADDSVSAPGLAAEVIASVGTQRVAPDGDGWPGRDLGGTDERATRGW